jgi:hypothetical protein
MKETIRSLWRETHDDNVIENIEQAAHGFTVGQAVKIDSTGTWILAQADDIKTSRCIGLVSRVTSENAFWVRFAGALPGEYIPGAAYYLSVENAGELFVQTDPEVWPTGAVREYIGTGDLDGSLLVSPDIDGDKTYHHTQAAPSRVWEVVHNLNKYPSVTITDAAGNEYESEVKHLDTNNTLLTFSEPFAGCADLN